MRIKPLMYKFVTCLEIWMLKSFTCPDLFRPAFIPEYLELYNLTVFLGGRRGINWIFNDIS